MKKEEFFIQFHEFLEIQSTPAFDENTDIKALDEYDSLMVMAIIAFIDEHFSTRLTATQLNNIITVKDLMILVGYHKFSE